MPRQSISFTTPNDAWLQAQVDSEEFNSKSEVVNDLVRRAREREVEMIRAKLIRAEQGAMSNRTPEEIKEKSKGIMRQNGQL